MSQVSKRNVRVQVGLHPAIYAVLAGCVLWMVATAWVFFESEQYSMLQLAVVSAFAATSVLLPFALSRLSGVRALGGSLREWLDSEIEIADGSLSARSALLMILCAPVAASLGFTVISLIAYSASIG